MSIQRPIKISRFPTSIVIAISHFSTGRRVLAVGRSPLVRKLERDQRKKQAGNQHLRSPAQQLPASSPPQEDPRVHKWPIRELETGGSWEATYRVRWQANDRTGAEEVLKQAAFKDEDPLAYLYLATEFTDPSSGEYESYLIKAASSGSLKAARKLGTYYFKKMQMSGSFPSLEELSQLPQSLKSVSDKAAKQEVQGMGKKGWTEWSHAFEWFSLGAESDIATSQIYLAIFLRANNRPDEGLEWLEKASKSRQWANTAASLKKMWGPKLLLDFNNLSIEE